ncbi:MAG: ParB-like nuclease domain protein [Betaproteobacteria bacterium ADurb.Bin341]|nr:MAG: ParB-like nuclease domain protein [Betaproteobacteria bacterium ADurb.Bin341]
MNKHTERLELVSIDKLIPYANNARTHSDEQIKKIQASLREFGFVNPVLIDKDCGIIAGHGRVEAAKREGMTEVPCVWVEHLTEAQKRAYILADNKLAELAGWDAKMLSSELDALTDSGFDLSIAGFEDFDIPFDAFDGEGDGGGSMMGNGTKVRVTIGALMFDIEDDNHAIYDKTKDADADYVQAQIVDLIARGELL